MNAPRGMTARDSGVELGIQWATCTAPLYGAVNGYVRITEGHPWFGLGYDAIDVDVHGGLTFGSDSDGWIGFDTLHSGDIWPGLPSSLRFGPASWDKHWTPELVAEETKRLARQAAAAPGSISAVRPTDVRIINRDNGESIPCELAYCGVNADGLHEWAVCESNRFDPDRDQISVGILPGKTAISFPIEGGAR